MSAQRPLALVATSSFGEFDKGPLRELEEAGLDIRLNRTGRTLTGAEVADLLKGVSGVIAGTEAYDRALLKAHPDLRVISRCGAGLDSVDIASARDLGVCVLSTPYGPTQAVAELTLGLILGLVRNVPAADRDIRAGGWHKPMGFLVGELTYGILGLGKIGKRVAEILRRFDAPVVGYDKNLDTAWCRAQGIIPLSWDDVLARADVVCLHLPLDPTLRHCIGKNQLGRMKPGSFLVNTSRGGLVDEDALAHALEKGPLAGAALDVFEEEPYRGKLARVPNALITPHMGSYARAGRIAMEEEAAKNMVQELRRQKVLS